MTFNFFSTGYKRAREEDDDEQVSFPEAKVRRSIKSCCLFPRPGSHSDSLQKPYSLPFRTSPTTKHTRLFSQNKRPRPRPLFTQTVTPQDSEEEDSPPFSEYHEFQSSLQQTENVTVELSLNDTPELEMDMGDDSLMSSPQSLHQQDDAMMLSPTAMMLSPKASPRTLLFPQVDALGLQESADTGRIPTPIYGHFQQQQQPGTVAPTSTPDNTSPSSLQSNKEIEYDQYLRSRRLPSPISEDEAMDFPPPQATIDSKSSEQVAPASTKYSGLRTPARLAQPLSPGMPQKHGKVMFSMGFRADCEMCRNRVPGHSNHIFRA